MSIEEIEQRRAERKAAAARAREEQYALDLAALDALEIEHGDGAVSALEAPSYAAGLPTLAIVKCPAAEYFKRFRDRARRAKGQPDAIGAATDELALSCIVYPAADVYANMCSRFPGLHDSAGARAIELAQAKSEDAKKG